MDKELECAVESLESWAEGQLTPEDPYIGICYNLSLGLSIPPSATQKLVARAAKSWSEFSGNPQFPVRHEHVSPESAYTATYDVPKWGDDAYGQARRRLCQHVANWIRENPEKALSFVRGA